MDTKEMAPVKASVIIPTKNPGEIFKRVLDGVLSQKTPWAYDILVIDSGSTDGTVEHCQRLERVKLHQIKPEDFGHGKTRNLGISLTSGEFAVMLTHDAAPANDHWLANLVAAVESNSEVAGAYGRHLPYDDASPFTKRDLKGFFDGFAAGGKWVRLEDKERYQKDQHYRQVLHFFSDNNSCLRRSVWQKIPYPDVDFAEDQLWAKQIIEAGYIKAYADDAVVYHSHTFKLLEGLQRSFDESYAFLRLFSYHLCPSVSQIFLRTLHSTAYDYKYLLKKGLPLQDIYWILRSPADNLLRNIGHYLGQRALSMPEWLISRISRDRTLKNRNRR